MTGRDSEAWADGPATDQELGMGGDTAPAARRTDADLPDPLFAVLGAVDLAVRAPAAAGKYYGQLVEHGHARLVQVGAERAVHKRVSRIEQTVTPRASKWAVKRSQRQRRLRRDRSA